LIIIALNTLEKKMHGGSPEGKPALVAVAACILLLSTLVIFLLYIHGGKKVAADKKALLSRPSP
jgi:hypothetical protein